MKEKDILRSFHDSVLEIETMHGILDRLKQTVLNLQAEYQSVTAEKSTAPASEASVPTQKMPEPIATQSMLQSESSSVVTPQPSGSWEVNFGIKWFSRLGIVALLIGLAMAFGYSFPYLPNGAKILIGGVFAGVLFYLGHRLLTSAPLLGRILQGGGVSLGYLSLFAVFFIPTIALTHNPGLGMMMLLLYSILILGIAHRLQSQTIAVLSVGYGYLSVVYAVNPVIAFMATGILSVVTIILCAMNSHWRVLSKMALVAAMGVAIHSALRGAELKELYLWSSLLIFHTAAIFAIRPADWVLLVATTFGFYFTYLSLAFNQPAHAVLEWILAALHLVTYGIIFAWKSRDFFEKSRITVLVLAMTFVGIATVRAFEGPLLPVVLASEALAFGFLSRQKTDGMSAMFHVFSITFISMALFALAIVVPAMWWNASTVAYGLASTWTCILAFILDRFCWRTRGETYFHFAPIFATLAYLEVMSLKLPAEWVTAWVVLTGFVLLLTGMLALDKAYRCLGIFCLAMAGLRLCLYDIAYLAMPYKILVFVGLGATMLAASYGYSILNAKLLTPSKEPSDA